MVAVFVRQDASEEGSHDGTKSRYASGVARQFVGLSVTRTGVCKADACRVESLQAQQPSSIKERAGTKRKDFRNGRQCRHVSVCARPYAVDASGHVDGGQRGVRPLILERRHRKPDNEVAT